MKVSDAKEILKMISIYYPKCKIADSDKPFYIDAWMKQFEGIDGEIVKIALMEYNFENEDCFYPEPHQIAHAISKSIGKRLYPLLDNVIEKDASYLCDAITNKIKTLDDARKVYEKISSKSRDDLPPDRLFLLATNDFYRKEYITMYDGDDLSDAINCNVSENNLYHNRLLSDRAEYGERESFSTGLKRITANFAKIKKAYNCETYKELFDLADDEKEIEASQVDTTQI